MSHTAEEKKTVPTQGESEPSAATIGEKSPVSAELLVAANNKEIVCTPQDAKSKEILAKLDKMER
jgi:hypothetical protein